jgi:hypothetical protein
VTRDALARVPTPEPMGPRHKPIHPLRLIDGIEEALSAHGLMWTREEYAINPSATTLFGVMDLTGRDDLMEDHSGISIGFRSSWDQSLSVRLVGGRRVFVCDNMALSGDEMLLIHKSTLQFDLTTSLTAAMPRLFVQQERMKTAFTAMRVEHWTRDIGIAKLWDLFVHGDLPLRLLAPLSRAFEKESEYGCTAWGTYQACTATIKALSPARRYRANLAVGRAFLPHVNGNGNGH